MYWWAVVVTLAYLMIEIQRMRRVNKRSMEMKPFAIILWLMLGLAFPAGLFVAYEIHKRTESLR